MNSIIAENPSDKYTIWEYPMACSRHLGGFMSKEQTAGQKTKKKAPKVRSYVRPTRVHTPKPKKKPKYPDREVEEELGDSSQE
jgi:hypothetical protein